LEWNAKEIVAQKTKKKAAPEKVQPEFSVVGQQGIEP